MGIREQSRQEDCQRFAIEFPTGRNRSIVTTCHRRPVARHRRTRNVHVVDGPARTSAHSDIRACCLETAVYTGHPDRRRRRHRTNRPHMNYRHIVNPVPKIRELDVTLDGDIHFMISPLGISGTACTRLAAQVVLASDQRALPCASADASAEPWPNTST